MKNWTKKLILGSFVCSLCCISAIPAYAGKVQFAFTTNASERRLAPGYKDDLEQAAYITTTQHSTSKRVVMGVDNGSQHSIATCTWTFSYPLAKKLDYVNYADMSRTYYLYTDPMGGVGTTIWGRYFP